MNPGPLTCEASALPLSYVPDECKVGLKRRVGSRPTNLSLVIIGRPLVDVNFSFF